MRLSSGSGASRAGRTGCGDRTAGEGLTSGSQRAITTAYSLPRLPRRYALGVEPYAVRNARLNVARSLKPHRCEIPVVDVVERGSAISRRHRSSRWLRIRWRTVVPCWANSRCSWRVDTKCARATASGPSPGSARCTAPHLRARPGALLRGDCRPSVRRSSIEWAQCCTDDREPTQPR